jgi:hypothetical protein
VNEVGYPIVVYPRHCEGGAWSNPGGHTPAGLLHFIRNDGYTNAIPLCLVFIIGPSQTAVRIYVFLNNDTALSFFACISFLRACGV